MRFVALALLGLWPVVVAMAEEAGHTLILLDRSASMREAEDGVPRVEMARAVFSNLQPRLLSDPTLGLRFFAGGKSGDKTADCRQTQLALAPGAARDDAAVQQLVAGIVATGHETPLAHALERAAEDLEGLAGPRKIILISDGQETCEQDPAALAKALSAQQIVIDTIGIGPPGSFMQLGEIALSGGGGFTLASNMEALQAALGGSIPGDGDLPIPPESADNEQAPPSGSEAPATAIPTQLPRQSALPAVEPITLPGANTDGRQTVAAEIILDASGSMMARLNGQTKRALALEALAAAVGELDTEALWLGFRAYGFDSSLTKTPEDSCPNTALLLPFANGESGTAVLESAKALDAYGYTPLAASLLAAGEDLQSFEADQRLIILISDGEETCGGDPAAAADHLASMGISLKTHVVGFDLDPLARDQMQAIAQAGKGRYFDAADGQQLGERLVQVIELAEAATDPWDLRTLHPVAGGDSFSTAEMLAPGTYTLTTHLPKGQERYFRVESSVAERALLRGIIQSRKAVFNQTGEVYESSVAQSGFELRLYRPDGSEVKGHWARIFGERGKQAHTNYIDLTGEGLVFSVGNRYDSVHKDALFRLDLDAAGDINPGQDAPSTPENALLAGGAWVGHLGLADKSDSYLVEASIHREWQLQFTEEAFRFRVELKDPATGKRLLRQTGLTGQTAFALPDDAPARVWLIISDNNPGLDAVFSSYRIGPGEGDPP